MPPELFGSIAVAGGFGHYYGGMEERRVEKASIDKENKTVRERERVT